MIEELIDVAINAFAVGFIFAYTMSIGGGCETKEGEFTSPDYVELWHCAESGAPFPYFCDDESNDESN